MTYAIFLLLFLVPPLVLFAALYIYDEKAGNELPIEFTTWLPLRVIWLHVVVAIVYTTPWDNYLVATSVWWYDPNRVAGIILGWVPIEEYTFFVLQTVMVGLFLLFLLRRMAEQPLALSGQDWVTANKFRWQSSGLLFVLWLFSVAILVLQWRAGTYLGLELVWALPPIILQTAFGGDILWRQRRLLTLAIASATLYLCIGDAVAIGMGVWTISPELTTGLLIGNLPLEEILFFLATNILVVFGITLFLSRTSHRRAPERVRTIMSTWLGGTQEEPNAL